MSDKTTDGVAISRKPDRASYLYLGACLVYAVVTLAVGGLRLPSFTVFVLFLTGAVLAWTLDVLVRYAADTRRIATASVEQVEIAREQCEREDKRALGGIAVLLLHSTNLPELYADQPKLELQRERWKVLTEIARAVTAIAAKEYVDVRVRIAAFVIHDGQLEEAASRKAATDLADEALTLADPDLMRAYKLLEKERAAIRKGQSSLSGGVP